MPRNAGIQSLVTPTPKYIFESRKHRHEKQAAPAATTKKDSEGSFFRKGASSQKAQSFFARRPSVTQHVQRKCSACEEERLQRKDKTPSQANAPSLVGDALSGSGNPLDNHTQSFMSHRFRYDFSHVKIHHDTIAAKSASAMNALAYTNGNNIVFNEGQYQPSTSTGKSG
jgi:hypothetical protein